MRAPFHVAGLICCDEFAGEAEPRVVGGLVARMLRDGGFEFGDTAGVRKLAAGGEFGALDRALDDDDDGDEHGERAYADDGLLPVHSHPHFEFIQHRGNGGLFLRSGGALVLLGVRELFEGLDFFLIFVGHGSICPEKEFTFF